MRISRGLILSLILIAVAAVAYSSFQDTLVNLPHWGTPASERPKSAAEPNGFTEEQWTIMEVCDQIVILLHPELIKESAAANRITAERNHSEPISYTVAEGLAKSTIMLGTSVWDPVTYQAWCKAVSTEAGAKTTDERVDILTALLKPETENFLALDERLSAELAKNPGQPEIYTDAALLLGTMAWFDGAGYFQDVRPLLNRMTAFLAVADALGAKGRSRDVAEILRLVLIHDQVGAVQKITTARVAGALPGAWLDALEVTATGDWRKTEPVAANGPLLLQLAHYHVLAQNMGADKAEHFLRKLEKPTGVNWVRYITQAELKVGQGHMYCKTLPAMEAAEANTVAKALGEGSVMKPRESYLSFMGKFDGRTSYEGPPQVRVVGVQLWAGRTQRHFLQAIVVLHHFLKSSLGVPEDAEELANMARKQFSNAYYLPFLSIKIEERRTPQFKQAQTAAENIAREHPAMVAPKLWAELKPETPEGIARHTPDFHRFYNPELPRETSFEAGKRIVEIGVGDENSLPLLKSILVRCPYDYEMAVQTALVEGRPDHVEEKRMECHEQFAAIHHWAMAWVEQGAMGNPQKYERLKLATVEWEPSAYLELAAYFEERGDGDKAEKYLLVARNKVDAVYFANNCGFLVKRYAGLGRMDEAESLAKEAADTYSGRGLATYAWLKEYRKQWSDAAATYKAIDERYGGSHSDSELLEYMARRKVSGEGWLPEYQSTIDASFPHGLEKVSLASFGNVPPTVGACFSVMSESLQKTGISLKDVVVGLDGYRVETREQYFTIRGLSESPDMVFLIWDGVGYTELKVHRPGRRFQVDLRDYHRK